VNRIVDQKPKRRVLKLDVESCLSCKGGCEDCLVFREFWWGRKPLARVETVLRWLGVPYVHTRVRRGFDLGESIELGEVSALRAGDALVYEADMGYVWLQRGQSSYGVDTRNIPELIREVRKLVESSKNP